MSQNRDAKCNNFNTFKNLDNILLLIISNTTNNLDNYFTSFEQK